MCIAFNQNASLSRLKHVVSASNPVWKVFLRCFASIINLSWAIDKQIRGYVTEAEDDREGGSNVRTRTPSKARFSVVEVGSFGFQGGLGPPFPTQSPPLAI